MRPFRPEVARKLAAMLRTNEALEPDEVADIIDEDTARTSVPPPLTPLAELRTRPANPNLIWSDQTKSGNPDEDYANQLDRIEHKLDALMRKDKPAPERAIRIYQPSDVLRHCARLFAG